MSTRFRAESESGTQSGTLRYAVMPFATLSNLYHNPQTLCQSFGLQHLSDVTLQHEANSNSQMRTYAD